MNTQFCVYIPKQHIRRIDLYFSDIFPEYSRSYINTLIDEGYIRRNGLPLDKDRRVTLGDTVSVDFVTQKYYLKGENMPLEIIFENLDFAVISKDAGINTHTFPGEYGKTGTLLNALLYYFGNRAVINGVERPGIVHRLDRDTSGLILIAKNNRAMKALQAKIANKQIRKFYYALVVGLVQPKQGILESYIGEDAIDHKKMTTNNPINAKLARTKYTTLEHIGGVYSLIEIELFTGRTHQIRVHMADMGHPIIGDKTYGNPEINQEAQDKYGLTRQWLHARKLSLELFDVEYEFVAPLKRDLKHMLSMLGIDMDDRTKK